MVDGDGGAKWSLAGASDSPSAILRLSGDAQSGWVSDLLINCTDGTLWNPSTTDGSTARSSARRTTTYFYTALWPNNATVSYRIDTGAGAGVPAGAGRRDSIKAGIANWSDRDGGNGPQFVFDGTAEATNPTLDACSSTNNKIYWSEGLQATFGYGVTSTCVTAPDLPSDYPRITKFVQAYEATPDQSAWYSESGSPGPNQWDLRSIVTHETGHATGFLGGPNNEGHFGNNSTRCPVPRTSATATMCPGASGIIGSTWLRSLESDDLSAIQDAYSVVNSPAR